MFYIKTNLEIPLNNAVKQLDNNNVVAACNDLTAFIKEITVKETNGQLIPQQATAIQQVLECA